MINGSQAAQFSGYNARINEEPLLSRCHTTSFEGVLSNFSEADYLAAVRSAVEYICAGDIFQVNLAQRLICPAKTPSLDLYLAMRQHNPAPFAGYFDLGSFQIASASPERAVSMPAIFHWTGNAR